MGLVVRRLARPSPRPTLRSAAWAWVAALATVCGAGLVLGVPSGLVPDVLEPAVGAALLAAAIGAAVRARRR